MKQETCRNSGLPLDECTCCYCSPPYDESVGRPCPFKPAEASCNKPANFSCYDIMCPVIFSKVRKKIEDAQKAAAAIENLCQGNGEA